MRGAAPHPVGDQMVPKPLFAFFRRRRLDFPARMSYLGALRLWSRRGRGPEFHLEDERPMAHKKIERKKELDRRRKRRAERMKLRAREARSGLKA